MRETEIRKRIQVSLAQIGLRLFRNNCGELEDKNGRWVQFGLCPGSSDLIGMYPIVVGKRRYAIFVAIEVKAPNSKTDPKRLAMQTQFIKAVNLMGGIAFFASSEEEAITKIKNYGF